MYARAHCDCECLAKIEAHKIVVRSLGIISNQSDVNKKIIPTHMVNLSDGFFAVHRKFLSTHSLRSLGLISCPMIRMRMIRTLREWSVWVTFSAFRIRNCFNIGWNMRSKCSTKPQRARWCTHYTELQQLRAQGIKEEGDAARWFMHAFTSAWLAWRHD